MFELERFVEACRAALADSDARAAVRETVARAVAEPAGVVAATSARRPPTAADRRLVLLSGAHC